MKKVLITGVVSGIAIFTSNVSGVGASTTMSPQEKINALVKDAHVVSTKPSAKLCKKLISDSRKYRRFQSIDSSMVTEWVEMTSYFEAAGIACNSYSAHAIKKAKYRAQELATQFKNGDENHYEVTK